MKLQGIRTAQIPSVKKILFVDDDANLLASLRRRLDRHFDIATALGGEEGLEVLERDGPFAVIISDQHMPGMDGIQFLCEVKKRVPYTARMMLTGKADLMTATNAINEGCIFRFYAKPCPPEVLKDAIEAGLGQYDLITAEHDLLERTLAGSVKMFIDVLSLADPEAYRKTRVVSNWVKKVARRMDLPSAWELEIAAMLTPIGTNTILTEIIAKLGAGTALSQAEENVRSRTPEIIRNLISSIPHMENLGNIVYYQMKGFDGSGFPVDAVSGNDLPLGSRILKVLNDLASISEYPDRMAIAELEKNSGLYDPEILRVVRSCLIDATDGPDVSTERSVLDVPSSDLRAGVRLAANIETLDEMLVLAARTYVTQAQIDLRIARDEARAADRAKSEFLAAMSHELRTPLNAIIGFSEIVKDEIFGPVGSAQYRDYAGDIHDSGKHLLGLINNILDLSKIESGTDELHEDKIEIPEIIRSAVKLVGQRAEQGGVKLEIQLPDQLPALRADERKLKQILVNLLSNAVKFTEAGGTVTFRAWCRMDSGYVFQIVDTGIGIVPEDIPKALSHFGQIDGDLNRQYEGTGLGLPLTKALVELHGGILDLQSEVGVGTTVTVRFPAERIVASLDHADSLDAEDRATS